VKTTIKLVAFMVATSGLSSAASMVVGNLVDIQFRVPILGGGAAPMDNTYMAKIGYFDPAKVFTTNDTAAEIGVGFVPAGDIMFASGDAVGYDGYFLGKVIFNDAAGLAGKDLSIWCTDGSMVNLVFTTSAVQFLADSAIPNENSYSYDTTTVGTFATKLGGTLIEVPESSPGAGDGYSYIGANVAIPETSTALLGALGALGLLRRRRI
jgi:hypothetical protein